MCVCVCVCVCVCACVAIHVIGCCFQKCIRVSCVCVRVYVNRCVSVCICVCACVCLCVCMSLCLILSRSLSLFSLFLPLTPHLPVYLPACLSVHKYLLMHVRMCAYLCVCIPILTGSPVHGLCSTHSRVFRQYSDKTLIASSLLRISSIPAYKHVCMQIYI